MVYSDDSRTVQRYPRLPMIKGHRPKAKPACPECGCTEGHRKTCKYYGLFVVQNGAVREKEAAWVPAKEHIDAVKEMNERMRNLGLLNADLSAANDLLERRLLNVISQNRELRARIHIMQETVANIKALHASKGPSAPPHPQ